MDLFELEKKVARLIPRRLRSKSDGKIVGTPPSRANRRAARIPQPILKVPSPPVAEVELVPTKLEPGARDVRERLLERGATPALADRIVREVLVSGARGAFAIDAAAGGIERAFAFEEAPRLTQAPHVMAFVGPTGAGKTSTLAKLGRKLAASGRDVFFATLDPFSPSTIGRGGRIGADLDRTELPLLVVRDLKELHTALVRAGGADLVLIDTPGLSPRDDEALDDLAGTLAQISLLGTPHMYAVLPASASRSALSLACLAFARLGPTAAVISKLDETGEPGASLEVVQQANLPLALLCDGQDLRAHLFRANASRVADLFLRGKMA